MCRQITLFHVRAAFFGSFYFLQPAIQKTGALLARRLLIVHVSYRAVPECDLSCCSLG